MKRQPANLSESLHQRLNSYALAASAAGVLALTQPAEAKIVYTKTYRHIPPNTTFNLDLNHDGITDFIISNGLIKGKMPEGDVVVRILGSNAVEGHAPPYSASALGWGVDLQPNVGFFAGYELFMVISSYSSGTHVFGQWFDVKPRYLGLQFLIQGEIHMGWARLCVRCRGQECHVLLTGYAYETIANQPIITGKVHGQDVITVEEGSLGALAAGAVRVHR